MPSNLQIEPETAETEGKRELREAQERYLAEQRQSHQPPTALLPSAPVPASSLGFWKIALAVLVGNLLTGIVAALLYAVSR